MIKYDLEFYIFGYYSGVSWLLVFICGFIYEIYIVRDICC